MMRRAPNYLALIASHLDACLGFSLRDHLLLPEPFLGHYVVSKP